METERNQESRDQPRGILGIDRSAPPEAKEPPPMRPKPAKILQPKDVIVILKLTTLVDQPWTYRELVPVLRFSPSTISDALQSAAIAKLYNPSMRQVLRTNLLEFLAHGIKYAYPAQRGGLVRGIPTSYAASPLVSQFPPTAEAPPVWAYSEGRVRGLSLSPIDPSVPRISLADPRMGELFVLIDAIRDGRARERALAIDELQRRLEPK